LSEAEEGDHGPFQLLLGRSNQSKLLMIKSINSKSRLALGLAVMLACGSISMGQAVSTTTTTTSAGTISEFSPDTIVMRSETSSEPLRYSYSKSTTYVDEAGAPVSIETVKSGLPVTVHYVKEGDRLIANRVIVRKHVTATETPAVVEKRTTTTTTTEKKDRDRDDDDKD
jgi:hypothetical protein